MEKSTIAFIAIIFFFLILFLISTIHSYDSGYISYQGTKAYRASPFYRLRAVDLYVHTIDENWKEEVISMHN
jgi:hypothetical protein